MITSALSSEARQLLGWSRDRLAPRSGVSNTALRLFEIGQRDLSAVERAAIRSALEEAGVEFTDNGGRGVQLRATMPAE